MAPVRHRQTQGGGSDTALLFAGGILGALLILVHTVGAIVPGLAVHYLYREENQPKLAALVILWALVVIGARFYLDVSA